MQSRVLTIMLTDMKGFTETTSRVSRDQMMNLLKRHDDLLRPIVGRFGGRVIKTIGDAFLVVFESPTNAVLCGLVIQHNLREYNVEQTNGDRIEVRISINVGEVQLTEDDVYGDPVNLSARINAVTDPGEVFFTDAVYLAMNKKEVPSSEIGERRFKGIPEPVKLFRVIQDPMSDQYQQALEKAGEPVEDLKEHMADEELMQVGVPKKRRWLPITIGIAPFIALTVALAVVMLKRDPWSARARKFLAAGGYPEAWQVIDERFKKAPDDPTVKVIAVETLESEVRSTIERDGYEKAVTRLDEHRIKRRYLTQADAILRRTRQEWARTLFASGKRDGYTEGLKVLWMNVEEQEKNPEPLIEYARAYAAWRMSNAYRLFPFLKKAIELDAAVAQDEWVKKTVLSFLREEKLSPNSSSTKEFWKFVAKHYGKELAEELRPLVLGEETGKRLAAFGVLSQVEELPEKTVFEYHRLNLFQANGDYHKEAVNYFEGWSDRKAEVNKMAGAVKFSSIPNLERYGARESEPTSRIVGLHFFDACREYLEKSVLAPEKVGRRYHAYIILKQKNRVSAETEHAYHIMNLSEYAFEDLRFRPRYLSEAIGYLRTIPPEAKDKRAAALKLVREKKAELAEAKGNKHVFRDDEVVKWLEENLSIVEKRLSE